MGSAMVSIRALGRCCRSLRPFRSKVRDPSSNGTANLSSCFDGRSPSVPVSLGSPISFISSLGISDMNHYFIDAVFGADDDTLERVLDLLGDNGYKPMMYSQLGDSDVYVDTETEIFQEIAN